MSEDTNPFDAAVAVTANPQSAAPADATAARLGYMAAQDTNPDVYAEAQRIARVTGVPTITALNVPEMKKQAVMGEIPFEAIARDAPATAALLADVERARIAHDDTANLTGVETTLRVLKGAGSSLLSSEAKFNEGAWGLLRAGSEVLGLDGIAGQAQRMGQNARARAESLVPKASNVLEAGLYSGMQSFGVNMLQLPLAFLPGGQAAAVGMAPRMAPALVSMGLNTGGQAFAEARDKGLSLPQALTFGASQGVIEAGTEMIGLPALFSALKPGQFGAKALEYLLKEQGGEQIATHLQDLNEWAVLPENKDKTLGDYLAARPAAALQTAIATAIGGGAQVAAVKGVGWAINRAEYAEYQAQQAEAQAKAIGELSQLVANSKVLQRSQETFKQFIEDASKDGPVDSVYLDGQTLHQSGLADQVAAVSPELAAQVQQAVETGGTVAIPVADYFTSIAPTPLAAQLQEHLRTEADGFSPAEAKQYMQSQGERLAAEVNAAVEQSQQGDEFRASADAVVADLRGQLDAAARFRPEVNDAYARVVGAYYATRAAALGTTPQELYERRRLTVGAQGNGALHQGGVVTTDTPEFRNWFGDSKVVDADGKPLVVYHGTAADFDAFSKPKATDKDGRRLGMGWGKGKFYFASTGEAASSAASFAAATGRGTAQNVMPVYLSMKNPIAAAEFMARVEAQMAAGKGRDQAIAAVDKAVRKEGYDGILDAETGGMAVFEPEQIKSATGNNGQFDPNDANILHQSSTPTEQATAKWLTSLESMLTGRKPSAKLDTPTVPKTMGEKSQELDLPRAYLEKIASKHPDVPAEVFENLPALLSNPLLAFGHKDGGVNVVIDAKSTKGSPIVVGVRDGRITTVTPMDAADGKTSQERIADAVERTYKADGKVYARNAKALADAKASLRDTSTNPGPKSGGSATPSRASPALIALQRASRDRANTILREHLVKRLGPDFYQNSEGPRGMFDPERLVITLTKGADFSTFLHESGHFFFENDIALASELLLNDAVHTEGEQQLLKDVSALLSWHGIQGPVDQQIAQWHNLSFEEKRSHHERTAESFEAYLFKGEAPSVELAPYFQRFRSWLLSVYDSLKDFLADYPEAGKLTPEVRAIFDRMLASNDAILQMEQARGMVPLFESAQQAGMSVEAWAAYQKLEEQRTQDGVQDLQARSLRDLQWARNARSRELKRLQKEARSLRKAAEADAWHELMQQPVYRAWRFLTAKRTEEDAIGDLPEQPKTGNSGLNRDVDSLLMAIAKLGGISRESAAQHLGVRKDDFRHPSGVFGAPVFRKEGGLSADAMLELLEQDGYVMGSEEGGAELAQLEELIADELGGTPRYSVFRDPSLAMMDGLKAGEQAQDLQQLGAGRLDLGSLREMYGAEGDWKRLQALRMTSSKGALHPDLVAGMFEGFTSGDHLVRALLEAAPPQEAAQAIAQQRMLEQHGELATPEALETAADMAIHNEARGRMVATELAALTKSTGEIRMLTKAAKQYAAETIARLTVRQLRPGMFSRAQANAAREGKAAMKRGDLPVAAAQKRNEIIQHYSAKAAHDAQAEVERGRKYLSGDFKNIDAEYREQIDAMLERFDLRKSGGTKRARGLAAWVESQREQGIEPDIPQNLLDEAERKSYKDMTVEEFRALLDSVKQIEHLGKLKHELLGKRERIAFGQKRDELVAGIGAHFKGAAPTRLTPSTDMEARKLKAQQFFLSHLKVANITQVMDGGETGGVVWDFFTRSAQERANWKAQRQAEMTEKLMGILTPVLKRYGNMRAKYKTELGISLTKEQVFSIALNMGNEGNRQRLLTGGVQGRQFTEQALVQLIETELTAADLQAVQAIWDLLAEMTPEAQAKHKRLYGTEMKLVEATPLVTRHGTLRGGYYPIVYDPRGDARVGEHAADALAKDAMKAAHTAATTRRSYTKARSDEVPYPLLLTMNGAHHGLSQVIHDLAWHEWSIGIGKMLRDKEFKDAVSNTYGSDVLSTIKQWHEDIVTENVKEQAGWERFGVFMRAGLSMAAIGYNLITAIQQPVGLTQSMARIGTGQVLKAVSSFIGSPKEQTTLAREKSELMRNRGRTQFRELAEMKRQIDLSGSKVRQAHAAVLEHSFSLLGWVQTCVDVPTWHAAYEKAMADGREEALAIAIADQAVIDTQGDGSVQNLSAVQRDRFGKWLALFYGYLSSALNMVWQTNRSERGMGRKTVDMLLLTMIPATLTALIKWGLKPSGGDDDEEKYWSLVKAIMKENITLPLSMFVGIRELSDTAGSLLVGDPIFDYTGPGGFRTIADTAKLLDRTASAISQGEVSKGLVKAAINVAGDVTGLPSAQANRTITGVQALNEGKTQNPAALVFGFQEAK